MRTRIAFAVALAAALGTLPASPSSAATIGVTTLDDERAVDGDCSLREAMQSAIDNVSADDCAKGQGAKRDTIELGPAEYDLIGPTSEENENADGDLDYTGGGPLTVKGATGGGSTIDSETSDRVIHATQNASALTLERMILENGDATGLNPASGGNVFVGSGSLTLDNVEIRTGEAGTGGGVFFGSGKRLRIDRADIYQNEAESGGALIQIGGGKTSISRTVFSQNSASGDEARGGAITYAGEALKVRDSMFLDNTATSDGTGSSRGGAINGRDLDLRRSLFMENRALESDEDVHAQGGAIYSPATRVVNATFYDNDADDVGGALYANGEVSHATFLANSADEAGDHVSGYDEFLISDELLLRNSILPGAQIAVDLCGGDGIVKSKGFNVATYDDPGCEFRSSDLTGIGNPGLAPGPPTAHGGKTWTIPIEKDAAAKNFVPFNKCKSAGGEDQRGFERPKGGGCDAGAYELGAKP